MKIHEYKMYFQVCRINVCTLFKKKIKYKERETFQNYKKFSWIEIDRTRNIPICTEWIKFTFVNKLLNLLYYTIYLFLLFFFHICLFLIFFN